MVVVHFSKQPVGSGGPPLFLAVGLDSQWTIPCLPLPSLDLFEGWEGQMEDGPLAMHSGWERGGPPDPYGPVGGASEGLPIDCTG